MGDVIHTLPAITDAMQINPKLQIDWVIENNFAEIPKWHPGINNVIPVAIRRWRKHPILAIKSGKIREFLHQLRANKYDLIIDAQGLLKSAIIARLAKGKRAGLSYKTAKEPLATIFYQKKYSIAKNQHAITRIRKLFARALNYSMPATEIDYGISTHFKQQTTKEDKDYLVFIPNSAHPEKCWPTSSWQELARLAATHNWSIKIPWGTSAEQDNVRKIASDNKNIEILPHLTLTELAKILAQSHGVVTIDTGLGHLAAALNTPTIALYGPTDPTLIGIIGAEQTHLTAANKKVAAIAATTVWKKLAS